MVDYFFYAQIVVGTYQPLENKNNQAIYLKILKIINALSISLIKSLSMPKAKAQKVPSPILMLTQAHKPILIIP